MIELNGEALDNISLVGPGPGPVMRMRGQYPVILVDKLIGSAW